MTKMMRVSTKATGSSCVTLAMVSLWALGGCGGSASSSLDSTSNPPANPTSTATTTPTATGTTVPTPATPPAGEYWMNFFPSAKGQVKVGDRFSAWIGLDLGQASKDYHPPDTFYHEGKVATNVETYQDLSGFCGGPVQSYMGEIMDVGPGQPTWIDHVTVVMGVYKDNPQVDPSVQAGPGDPVCLGYRIGSQWTWDLAIRNSSWQPAEAHYTVDLQVRKDAVNALRIMFNGNMPRSLEQVRIATKPGP